MWRTQGHNWMETEGPVRESASQHNADKAGPRAEASCIPHSNPGLGSPLPLILQLEKLDANQIKLSLASSLAVAIWQSLSHILNERLAFLLLFFFS